MCILPGRIKREELRVELIEVICDTTAQKGIEEGQWIKREIWRIRIAISLSR
jgi:hypothetical protein